MGLASRNQYAEEGQGAGAGLGDTACAELEVEAVAVNGSVVVAADDRQVSVETVGQFKAGHGGRLEVQQAADKVFDEDLVGKIRADAIGGDRQDNWRSGLDCFVASQDKVEIQEAGGWAGGIKLVQECATNAEVQLEITRHAACNA